MQGNPRQATLYAYLAGVFDGEGSVRMNKCFSEKDRARKRKNPWYYVQLCIGMVDKHVIELFAEVAGAGGVREECVPNRRSIWRWSLTGRAQIVAFLAQLRPYLRVKDRQADIALAVLENWEIPFNRKAGVAESELRRREEAYQAIRKLNAVGAAATTKCVGTREGEAIV